VQIYLHSPICLHAVGSENHRDLTFYNSWNTLKDNIKMDLREIGSDVANWIQLA
jgi:hypothetical protein